MMLKVKPQCLLSLCQNPQESADEEEEKEPGDSGKLLFL